MYQIGIVAHREREQMADQLAEHIQPAVVSVDTGRMGANTNHLFVWNHLAAINSTWSVVLEDDAQPIDDFRTHLEAALTAAPFPIVSLYLGQKRPPQHQADIQDALAKADANQAHWIIATQLYHAVAVAIHTELLPDMLNSMKSYLPIDENIGQWSRRAGHPIAYTVPSLVNHLDGPTLITHPDGAEREPGRVAHRVGTHHTWNQTCVEI
jgi:hypothetical protein